MTQALRQLGEDLLSAILFFALYALTGSLVIAVAVAVAVGLAQLALQLLAGRPVQAMQWMSLSLVIVLGGASILFHTPRFVMLKPSIVHLAIAAIMLQRGWMRRYMPPIALDYAPAAVDLAGYAWAVLMTALAVANLFFALETSVATWAWFVSVGAFGAKAVALALQYVVFRVLVRRAVAAGANPVPGPALPTTVARRQPAG
jgi:intracellular septation protein A